MDNIQVECIQENFTLLVNSLDARDIIDYLYQEQAISSDEVQEFGQSSGSVGKTRKERTRQLLLTLQTRKNGYRALVKSLSDGSVHGHLLRALKDTEKNLSSRRTPEYDFSNEKSVFGHHENSSLLYDYVNAYNNPKGQHVQESYLSAPSANTLSKLPGFYTDLSSRRNSVKDGLDCGISQHHHSVTEDNSFHIGPTAGHQLNGRSGTQNCQYLEVNLTERCKHDFHYPTYDTSSSESNPKSNLFCCKHEPKTEEYGSADFKYRFRQNGHQSHASDSPIVKISVQCSDRNEDSSMTLSDFNRARYGHEYQDYFKENTGDQISEESHIDTHALPNLPKSYGSKSAEGFDSVDGGTIEEITIGQSGTTLLGTPIQPRHITSRSNDRIMPVTRKHKTNWPSIYIVDACPDKGYDAESEDASGSPSELGEVEYHRSCKWQMNEEFLTETPTIYSMPRANRIENLRKRAFLTKMFDELSSLINDGNYDLFHSYQSKMMEKTVMPSDVQLLMLYLTASAFLWKNERDECDRVIDHGLSVVPCTTHPSRALVEMLSSLCWMYFQDKKYNKLNAVLDDALQIIHQDPKECTGRPAGWIYIDKARLNMAMMMGKDISRLRRLRSEGIACLETAMQHFKSDDSKDGPFGYNFAGTMLASMLLCCGNRLNTLHLEPSIDDVERSRKVLSAVEDSPICLPGVLLVHVLLAKCDYFIRKGSQYKERALEQARQARKLSSQLSMPEIQLYANDRLRFLENAPKIEPISGQYIFSEVSTADSISTKCVKRRKKVKRVKRYYVHYYQSVVLTIITILLFVFVMAYLQLLDMITNSSPTTRDL